MKNILKLSFLIILALPVFVKAQDKTFLKKYAGTYHMLVNEQKETGTSDKYILKPDGSATWTMFTAANKSTTKQGKWLAEEGVIHLKFSLGQEEGGDLLSDFNLKDGAFRAENVFLKKVVAKAKK